MDVRLATLTKNRKDAPLLIKDYSNLKAYLFIGLALVFFIVFLVYPILFSLGLSFFEWKGYTPNPFEKFTGLSNYIKLIKDPTFLLVLKNTLYFVFGSLIFQNLFGFIIAVFLFYGKLRASILWRAIIFFPTLLSSVIIGLVWRRIFVTDGLLNTIINIFLPNLEPVQWLGNLVTPIFVITLVSIWQWTGYNMVIYYAGLQGINNEIIESAKVDGANFFQTIIKIVLPQLYKTISLAVILNIIGGFKVFDLVYVMTSGGPAHHSEVITSYMYYQSFAIFGTNKLGYASTLAVVLTVIVLIFATIRIFIDKKTD
ncbi:MAG: sugar ABC transporter permease [Actinobacteria bacterium]|nr:sugar ABC transporter permease [Actinomycetota bacterium]